MSEIHIRDYNPGAQPEGQTWDTTQLQEDFEVLSFLAPRVRVRRKSDGKLGWLNFRHRPRVYYGFKEEE